MSRFLITLLFCCLSAQAAQASDLRNACLSSDRGKGRVGLCSCIQSVANQSLSKPDQRRARSFFKDPDLAEQARISDRRRDEEFWDRYERFSAFASRQCRNYR